MQISLKKTLGLVALALGFALSAGSALAQYKTITNDVWWKTTSGSVIYAQSGFITKIGSTYYWYGVEYAGAVSYVSTGTSNSNTGFVGINCYTSPDLATWTFASTIVAPSSKILASDYVGRIAGVIKNSAGTYVLWAVYEGSQETGKCG